MATMNVSLPDPMKDWVEAQARTGRFSNASDYVRDLIRRDQERQLATAEIQRLASEGIASGPAEAFHAADFLASMRRRQAGGTD
jgi:antitoxin ParD1/3/4